MKRSIKAIFFDIDGTLRDFETGRVLDSTKEALTEARKAGILLFIATGRHKLEMEEEDLLEGIPFDGYVTLNGQYCYCGDNIIYDYPIDPAEVDKTLEILKEESFPCMFMEGDCMYINMVNSMVEKVQLDIGTRVPPVLNVERARGKRIYQIVPYVTYDMECKLSKHLAGCEFIRWKDEMACDVIPSGGSKWKGIMKMAEHYGFSACEMAAVGDGMNDISMLTGAGLGIAMGNACDAAKEAAAYITDTIEADGLKKAVYHILAYNSLGGIDP